jgi:hypothetical protein
MDFQIGGLRFSQAEMQAAIIARAIAGLADHLLNLLFAARAGQDPRLNRAAIGPCTDQLHLEPAVIAPKIIAQQRGWLVQVDDQDIEIAIFIEVAKRAPPRLECSASMPGPATSINSSNFPLPRLRKMTRGVL